VGRDAAVPLALDQSRFRWQASPLNPSRKFVNYQQRRTFSEEQRATRKTMSLQSLTFLAIAVTTIFGARPIPAPHTDFPAKMDQILNAPVLRGGITACIVESLSDDTIVYARNADTRVMPASNRKLFTTAAVLSILGDDYTLTTRAFAAGAPTADGTLAGDITLRGGGDSLLSPADLDELAKSVAAAGVKHVLGGVVGDGSVFVDGPYGADWGWDTLNDDYAPVIAGLELTDGDITVDADGEEAAGAPVTVQLDPPSTLEPVINNAVTGAAGTASSLAATRAWSKPGIIVTGTLPPQGHAEVQIPVLDPVAYAAEQFRASLVKAGVIVDGPASTTAASAASGAASSAITAVQGGPTVTLATHVSPPMSQYIAFMNKPSDNLLAESLVRDIGIAQGGQGSYAAGDAAEMKAWRDMGIDTGLLSFDDGCGVSRRDYVTVREIAQLLAAMAKRNDFDDFQASLPIAGVDGTLKHRFVGTPAQGNVHAKTGTLTSARALSGYLTARSGKRYLFSIVMNNYPGSAPDAGKVQDGAVEEMIKDL
jgi:serine-type D-Ala-D-Ala carboxypeptidase/endopeptidase (penicillin-binding protein 4)